MKESTKLSHTEAKEFLGLTEIVEQEIKDVLCTELPTVVKHLTTVRENLNKTIHPFKYAVLGWVIKIFEFGQTALSCPVETKQ